MSAPVSPSQNALNHLPPFDTLEPESLAFLEGRLEAVSYAEGEVLMEPAQGLPSHLYIVLSGQAVGVSAPPAADAGRVRWSLAAGDLFPLGALLSRRPVSNVYRAEEETVCIRLKTEDFAELLRLSPVFHGYCTRRLAELLAMSGRHASIGAGSQGQDPLNTPLSVLVRRGAVTCRDDTPVRLALEIMRRENIGSILLTDAEDRPSGMFTLKDLRDRVALGACNIEQPMSRVMTPNPFSLPDDAPAFEAALAMARRSIHHVVVTREGKVAGVISEKDLFALQQVGVSRIASTLCVAEDLPTLRRAAEDTRRLARNLMSQGVGAEQLTRLISQLNDQLTQRILYLAFADNGLEDVNWCWLALGSEGRFEQTLHTDQDNGLIFVLPEGADLEGLRVRLLAASLRANEWLDACGFPLCKGEVMASNPKWCLSLEEWKSTFGDWIFRGDAPVLLNASIFFDFRALAGDVRLAEELRTWLHEHVKEHRMFLRQMVQNALGNRPPVGLVRDFVVSGEGDEAGTLDLKINGATLFVDAARIFALAAGAESTNTVQRLRAAGETWRLNKQEVEAWVEAFIYIQQMRLGLHQSQLEDGKPLSNRLDPDRLSTVERQGLKEAFRQAKKLQGRLETYFQF